MSFANDYDARSDLQGGSNVPPAADDDEEYYDEDAIWSTNQAALPPVIGRYDKDSGEPLMHYSDDVIQNSNKEDAFDWTDSEGTSIDIGF